MDATVTARVPVEIRDQANTRLKDIGATPTALINAAYTYVLETGALPTPPTQKARQQRSSDAETKAKLQAFLSLTQLKLSPELAQLSAKDIRRLRVEERYGSQ